MQKLTAIGVVLALAIPAALTATAEEQPYTLYDRVVDDLIATYGFLPTHATVNGVEGVPTEQALALLSANRFTLGQAEDLYLPPSDAGFGVRQGSNSCLIGAILTAQRITVGGYQEALVDEETAAGPGGTIACGVGFAYGTGVAGAAVAPGAFAVACVNVIVAGSWVNSGDQCIFAPTAANLYGHAGFVDIKFNFFGIFFHIEQVFAGVRGWAPAAAGNQDVGGISIA